MNNAGLPSLTATLYPDPNWMVLPRATMSSYQVPVGIDDLEDGMPSMIPQKIPGEYGWTHNIGLLIRSTVPQSYPC